MKLEALTRALNGIGSPIAAVSAESLGGSSAKPGVATVEGANQDRLVPQGQARADRVAIHGVSRSDLPALLDDWRAATLESAVMHTASAWLDPRIAPSLQAAEQAAGRVLTRAEAIAVIDPILATIPPEERFRLQDLEPAQLSAMHDVVAPVMQKCRAAYLAHPQATLDAEVARVRANPPRRDPFTPIAQAAPKERGEERVLWENQTVMVVVDLFARKRFEHSHVLVIPKRRAMLPIDLHPRELDELAKVCAATRQVFAGLSAAQLDNAYFNPPGELSVSQAHAHLETGIPDGTSDRALDKLYDRAAIELAAALRKQL